MKVMETELAEEKDFYHVIYCFYISMTKTVSQKWFNFNVTKICSIAAKSLLNRNFAGWGIFKSRTLDLIYCIWKSI